LIRPLAFCAVLAVAACASVPAPEVALAGLPAAFEMRGRIAVRHRAQGEMATLRWQRTSASDTWVLATPLGTELARIERDAEGLTVYRPGSAPLAVASFAELTENLLGGARDDRLLVAWLHGRPAAGSAGWAVHIDESQFLAGREVARRLTATRDDTVVKLVVDAYQGGSE